MSGQGRTDAERVLPGAAREGEWHRIESGESAARVFRRTDGRAFAKLVPPSLVTELREERDRTEWAARAGIPSAPVLDWTESSAGACLVTGAVPGVPADGLDPERAVRAWPLILCAARRVHELASRDCPFDRGVDRMISLASAVVAAHGVNHEFLRPEQQDVDPRLLLEGLLVDLPRRQEQEADDLVVCHGDLCLPNIRVDPRTLEVTGFIDLGRLGRADRHADLALLLANAQDTWPVHAERLESELERQYGREIEADRLRFYLHLDPLTWE